MPYLKRFIKNGDRYIFGEDNQPKIIDYILVGGGGAGGRGCPDPNDYLGGGGGGGEVVMGSMGVGQNSICITIGARGTPNTSTNCCCVAYGIGGKGGDSCIGNYVIAHGGQGGMSRRGGTSGSGCYGGIGFCKTWSSGGGGAGGAGSSQAPNNIGQGGAGICGYGPGGPGGNPVNGMVNGTNATCYGGGGGGTGNCAGYKGGCGRAGIAKICYKTDGSCGIKEATGGTITTSGGYTIHTFTSSGTFTILS